MHKIGIIGAGFVGRAVGLGFSLHADVKMYDKIDNNYHSLEDTVNSSDFLFVCVPTPMDEDGSQDLSCVLDAISNLDRVAEQNKIIILKSTVIPGTTKKLAKLYPRHTFIFNPEFLTQRTANFDFINPSRIIIGGETNDSIELDRVEDLFRSRFNHHLIFKTTWEGAELVKYMSNCFFAAKISFCNEFYDIAQRLLVNYEDLRDMWLADGRIANSHTDVPGHDGDRGYGGKCFPKDVRAMIKWSETNGISPDMLLATEKVNSRVRSVKDWEGIKGATSKNKH